MTDRSIAGQMATRKVNIRFMNKKLFFSNPKEAFRQNIEQFLDVIRQTVWNGELCDGPEVKSFEKAFAKWCGVSCCSGVDSGTDALFLGMKALGIGQGDEVIVPANTFCATPMAVKYNQAVPVFCDCDANTWEILPCSVERCITQKTKAIICVHMYGQSCEMEPILQIAKEYDLLVIEDCAQAHGALYRGKKVGGLADLACFSFYPTKNLGAGGLAGCVLTEDVSVKEMIDHLKSFALDRQTGDHTQIGYNMRMDSIQAALLEYKLQFLDADNHRRKEIAKAYYDQIHNPRIRFQTVCSVCDPVLHLFCIAVNDRDRFMAHMQESNIICGIHYPVPCHLQRAFRDLHDSANSLPNSEYLSEHCVSIPMYPTMTDEDVARVVDACNRFGG